MAARSSTGNRESGRTWKAHAVTGSTTTDATRLVMAQYGNASLLVYASDAVIGPAAIFEDAGFATVVVHLMVLETIHERE